MSPRGRAVLSGLAVAGLFALPLLPEIVGTRRLVFRDAQITHFPWRRAAEESLDRGEVPFINEAASGGQPLLANPNAVILYPTFLLETVLPASAAFNLHYLLHVLWAFFGARLFASRLGMPPGAAFFSGVVFAFSRAKLSYGSAFMNSSASASWLPWCAAAALGLARASDLRGAVRASAATGIALGLQLLAGEPALSLLTGLFLLFLTLFEVFSANSLKRSRRVTTLLTGGLGAGLLAFLLAAPLYLPLAQIFSLTYRGQHLYSERAFGASPFLPWRMIEWLFPRFSGDPGALGAGASWLKSVGGEDLIYLWSVTLGVVPFLLLLMAALRKEFWERRTRLFAAVALVSFLFSLGFALPFYRLLYSMDFLRRLRYPIKFYLLTTLCVAVLAGLAAESLRRRRAGRGETLVLAAALTVYAAGWALSAEGGALDHFLAPILAGLSAAPSAVLAAFRVAVRGDALLGAAAVLALLLLIRRPVRGLAYALGLSTLVFSFPWGLPLFVSAREKELARPPALLSAVAGEGRLYVSPGLPRFDLAAMEAESDHPLRLPRAAKVARVLVEELIPQTAAPFGVKYIFDHDPDGSYGYYNRLAGEAISASTSMERDRLLRLYGARWVLAEEGEEHPLSRPVTGFAVAGRRLVLHEFTEIIPPIRWAGRVHLRASLSGALDLLRSERFEPRTDIVLPGRADRDASTVMSTAKVFVERERPDRATVRTESADAGYLLFSRTYFSAWKASLDGKAVPVRVGNARDLAVAVPAGAHHVAFWYDRAPFHRGVFLQGATFLLIGALTISTSKRKRAIRKLSTLNSQLSTSSSLRHDDSRDRPGA